MYKGVTPEEVKEVMEKMEEHTKDREIVLLKAFPTSIIAPSKTGKNKGLHRLSFDILLDADAIEGAGVLMDFGAIMVMHIPKDRLVKDDEVNLFSNEEESE